MSAQKQQSSNINNSGDIGFVDYQEKLHGNFGAYFIYVREWLGYSVAQLADHTQLNPQIIKFIEDNNTPVLTQWPNFADLIAYYAIALNIDPDVAKRHMGAPHTEESSDSDLQQKIKSIKPLTKVGVQSTQTPEGTLAPDTLASGSTQNSENTQLKPTSHPETIEEAKGEVKFDQAPQPTSEQKLNPTPSPTPNTTSSEKNISNNDLEKDDADWDADFEASFETESKPEPQLEQDLNARLETPPPVRTPQPVRTTPQHPPQANQETRQQPKSQTAPNQNTQKQNAQGGNAQSGNTQGRNARSRNVRNSNAPDLDPQNLDTPIFNAPKIDISEIDILEFDASVKQQNPQPVVKARSFKPAPKASNQRVQNRNKPNKNLQTNQAHKKQTTPLPQRAQQKVSLKLNKDIAETSLQQDYTPASTPQQSQQAVSTLKKTLTQTNTNKKTLSPKMMLAAGGVLGICVLGGVFFMGKSATTSAPTKSNITASTDVAPSQQASSGKKVVTTSSPISSTTNLQSKKDEPEIIEPLATPQPKQDKIALKDISTNKPDPKFGSGSNSNTLNSGVNSGFKAGSTPTKSNSNETQPTQNNIKLAELSLKDGTKTNIQASPKETLKKEVQENDPPAPPPAKKIPNKADTPKPAAPQLSQQQAQELILLNPNAQATQTIPTNKQKEGAILNTRRDATPDQSLKIEPEPQPLPPASSPRSSLTAAPALEASNILKTPNSAANTDLSLSSPQIPSDVIVAPILKRKVQPIFPSRCSVKAGDVVDVRITYNIDAAGKVIAPTVVESSDSCFNKAALKAAKKHRFTPQTVNGIAKTYEGATLKFQFAG